MLPEYDSCVFYRVKKTYNPEGIRFIILKRNSLSGLQY